MRRLLVGLTLAFSVLAAVGCGDDEAGPNIVDVRVTDSAIEIPESLAPGFTTFRIDGQSEGDNHLLFLRANPPVTQDEMKAGIHAGDGSVDPLVTIVGGNGGMPKGSSASVTFELDEGVYGVVLFTDVGELAAEAYFTVGAQGADTIPPDSDGVIEMGPGLVFSLPSDFDGEGTFKVTNEDREIHEAAFVRLLEGLTIDDAREWAIGGFQGPMPFVPAGGFGALAGGSEGWIEADLAPGNYAIICWIPAADGIPHWINGMSASFTVN